MKLRQLKEGFTKEEAAEVLAPEFEKWISSKIQHSHIKNVKLSKVIYYLSKMI